MPIKGGLGRGKELSRRFRSEFGTRCGRVRGKISERFYTTVESLLYGKDSTTRERCKEVLVYSDLARIYNSAVNIVRPLL